MMLKLAHHITTVVRSKRRETDRITTYELADPDDWDLPGFTAGAHLDVHLAPRMVRSYSLCGDPAQRTRYWITVQREDEGRGGSVSLERQLVIGAVVPVSLPKNHFPLATFASRHVLIAGGIGITPFMSMMAVLRRQDTRFQLHYCARTAATMAFREQLERAPPANPVRLYFSRDAGAGQLSIAALLESLDAHDHIYCCGPERLVAEVLERTSASSHTVHVERFGAAPRAVADKILTVELRRSGRIVEVAPGETILEALRKAEVEIDASCEAGACRSCKVRHLGGVPIHRDLALKPAERQEFMLPCVSGCSSERLILDL